MYIENFKKKVAMAKGRSPEIRISVSEAEGIIAEAQELSRLASTPTIVEVERVVDASGDFDGGKF